MNELREQASSLMMNELKRFPDALYNKTDYSALFNASGANEPILWIFNKWWEPVVLARALGPEYPLLAFSSLHGALFGKAAKKTSSLVLARIYYEDSLSQLGREPTIIGANCQSVSFAEALAHYQLTETGRAAHLIAMDRQFHYYYPGGVAYFFGEKSYKFNPFLKGEDPSSKWKRQFGSARHQIIPGEHGHYFIEPTLSDLAALIRNEHEFVLNAPHTKASQRGASPEDPVPSP